MDSKIIMNADLIANGTVYANGPVIVQGVDIKAELEKLRFDLRNLDQKFESRVVEVFNFVIQHYEIKEEERSNIKNGLETFKTITDWGGRVEFLIMFFSKIGPILSAVMINLIKYGVLK